MPAHTAPVRGSCAGAKAPSLTGTKKQVCPLQKRHITLQMKLFDLATMLDASLGADTAELSLPQKGARETNNLSRTGKLLL